MLSPLQLLRGGALAASLLLAQTAHAVTIDSFQFNGVLTVAAGGGGSPATINFLPDFTILTQNGAISGGLVGLTGNIAGDYTFDDPAGSTSVLLDSPSAPNAFTIFDGVDTFSAEVDLIELQGGGGGTIFGAIDFLSSSYTGANADLTALNAVVQSDPNLTVTFQTLGGSGVDLDDLFENGSNGVAAYSAAVQIETTSVPEPAPLALLGLGLLCSVVYASRRARRATG
ncbi:MAG: PEP-CTERM sorting domain-containing protein [Geminicoccaceae bacterium]